MTSSKAAGSEPSGKWARNSFAPGRSLQERQRRELEIAGHFEVAQFEHRPGFEDEGQRVARKSGRTARHADEMVEADVQAVGQIRRR